MGQIARWGEGAIGKIAQVSLRWVRLLLSCRVIALVIVAIAGSGGFGLGGVLGVDGFANPAALAESISIEAPATPTSTPASDPPGSSPQIIPFYPYPPAVWQKFDEVRQDPRIEQLIQRDIENSVVIRQLIRDEVDRSFSFTTTLLNVLLAVLTASPLLLTAGFWYLRRSVITQVMTQTQQQLREEVEKQLTQEAADELKQQADAFKQELETLRAEFSAQLADLKGLASDTEREKNAIIGKLAEILPLPVRDSDSPELHQKVQTLTQQLTALKAANERLSFSAADYVEQGKAFYYEKSYAEALAVLEKARAEDATLPRAALMQAMTLAKLQRYEAAIAAYDETLALSPDSVEAWFGKATVLNKQQNHEAAIPAFDKAISLRNGFYQSWFGKARAHAGLKQREQALVALQQAIAIEGDKCREAARSEAVFADLRDLDDFRLLVGEIR